MLHKAIDIAEPGDVIIVDGGGDLTNSLIGEMMSSHAEYRGIAGIVIYGAIRDYDVIHAGKFPIFAAGVTHRGPYKDGPGEINVPIAIDGMVIEPGDPDRRRWRRGSVRALRLTAEVLKATTAKHEAETRQLANIKAGKNDRAWVDVALKKLGVAF